MLYKGIPTTESYKTIQNIVHKTPSEVKHIEKVRDILNQKVDNEIKPKPCLNTTETITTSKKQDFEILNPLVWENIAPKPISPLLKGILAPSPSKNG